MKRDWDKPVRLHELGKGVVTMSLEADAGQRAEIAKRLGLEGLPKLAAKITLKPWLDGAELDGRFEAVVEQVCGVSLDPFEQPVAGEIFTRVVPAGSPHAPEDGHGEIELDPEAADPPDVLDGDAIDLAEYVMEHLALELDPFPRKPGVEFDYRPPTEETSPFAALKKLKEPKP